MSDLIHAHSTWLPTYGGRQVRPDALSQRDLDVIGLLARGHSHAEIGRELHLTDTAVRTFVRAAYRKIGVARRSQAVAWSLRNGLLDTHPGSAA